MDQALEGSAIFLRLTDIIHRVFYDESIVITPETTARDVPGWDSLGHVRLLVEIEKAFSLRFHTIEIGSLRSVGQLAELIEKKRLIASSAGS